MKVPVVKGVADLGQDQVDGDRYRGEQIPCCAYWWEVGQYRDCLQHGLDSEWEQQVSQGRRVE